MTTSPGRRIVWSLAAWIMVLACGATARSSRAHADSDAAIELFLDRGQLRGSWEGALRDLDHALALDEDGDGKLTRAEWDARREEATHFVRRHLACSMHGRLLHLETGSWSLPMTLQGRAARLEFTAVLPSEVSGFLLEYTAFFDSDPWHRGHVRLTRGDGSTAQAVLSPDRRSWRLDSVNRSAEITAASRFLTPWVRSGALAAVIGVGVGWLVARRPRARETVP